MCRYGVYVCFCLFLWLCLYFIFLDCDLNGELQDLLLEYNFFKDIDYLNVIKLLGVCIRNGIYFIFCYFKKIYKFYFLYIVEKCMFFKEIFK